MKVGDTVYFLSSASMVWDNVEVLEADQVVSKIRIMDQEKSVLNEDLFSKEELAEMIRKMELYKHLLEYNIEKYKGVIK